MENPIKHLLHWLTGTLNKRVKQKSGTKSDNKNRISTKFKWVRLSRGCVLSRRLTQRERDVVSTLRAETILQPRRLSLELSRHVSHRRTGGSWSSGSKLLDYIESNERVFLLKKANKKDFKEPLGDISRWGKSRTKKVALFKKPFNILLDNNWCIADNDLFHRLQNESGPKAF